MYAESRRNKDDLMRAIRAFQGPVNNGQVVAKKDNYEWVATRWCKIAVMKEVMKNGLFRVHEGDPKHVKVLDVMDKFKCDLARDAGIPTTGALCAKAGPSKFPNVSAASLYMNAHLLLIHVVCGPQWTKMANNVYKNFWKPFKNIALAACEERFYDDHNAGKYKMNENDVIGVFTLSLESGAH